MHIAYHHVMKRRRLKKQNPILRKFDLKSIMDKLVYISAIFGVFANIPQLTKIWIDKSFAGVSIVTWLGFLLGSSFWLFYGIVHKEKPIIITNGLYVVIQFFIVLGLVVHNVPFTFF